MTDPKTPKTHRAFGVLGHLGFATVIVLGAAWAFAALSIHLEGAVLWAALATLTLTGAAALALRRQSRGRGWALVAIAALALVGWYQTLQPSQNRLWAADVARGVTYSRTGDIITLENLRNFDWRSDTAAVPAWESRSYDLTTLASVDMLTSVWDNPNLAHLIVSFGFDDGSHVAFSIEIRKEAHESFSAIGGFFRQFELVLIAADERDVVRLRTNLRHEDVHLFPVRLTAEQRQTLLLSYLDLGNALAAQPQFYNTVTANCTSTVYRLVQVIKPDMPLDHRLLLSGQLPEYIDELGGLFGNAPMPQRRGQAAITARAQSIRPDQDFSALIRRQN